jgi:hypothetical protein
MSDDLIPLYKEMAATGINFPGLAILQHKTEIGQLIKKHGAKKVLDFGCGRGDAYKAPHRLHSEWGMKWWDVTLYDPAFPRFMENPHGKYDAVLCSDVLEHIPEDQLEDFIANLFSYAYKFVWASACCRPAKKTFPDGVTNLHVTLQPMDWWRAKFAEIQAAMGSKIPYYLSEST